MTKFLYIAVLFLTGLLTFGCQKTYIVDPLPASAAHWQNVGKTGYSVSGLYNPSLFLYNSSPYAAYADSVNGNKLTVAAYLVGALPTVAPIPWQIVGNGDFSTATESQPSLFVDNGTPYVLYEDQAYGGKATVMKYSGSTWVTVGTPGFSGAGYPTLYVDNGTPYVFFLDGTLTGTVMAYNGSAWVTVGNSDFTPGGIAELSLCVYNETPYAAYFDGTNIGIQKLGGSAWTNVGSGLISQASYPSLYIDNGTPYMSFIGEGLLTTVVKYNGTAWVTVGNAGFSAPSFAPSLSVYNGTPYVAFADANTSDSLASVMKCDGSSWTYVGNKGFSVDTANNMFLNIFNGIPYVIFEDSGNIVWVMKYQ